MNILLDTHILLWYLDDNPKLPVDKRLLIEDGRHSITVSVASLWEMTIKACLGKLNLMDDLPTIENILRRQGIAILPIQTPHLARLLDLPLHHRDPFDRIIISQALVEELTVLSDDGKFSAYPILLAYCGI
jgi:PIN domain nuclease of toxin-antitoxin system